jgi:hypothetical protein
MHEVQERMSTELERDAGPHLGMLAIIFTVLFNTGLYFVTSFAGTPYFPGPWEPAARIVSYFQARPSAVLMCSFFHFGAAVVLGLFTASAVSRLRFLGVNAAGPYIAFFGGLATAVNMFASASILWVMAYPGIAQNADVVRSLYYLQYAVGGVGFSVPLGLLIAGISVPGLLGRLLPKWIAWFGLLLAVVGEASWFSMLFPKLLFLIPFTRFPGFLWLILAGFAIPKSRADTLARSA